MLLESIKRADGDQDLKSLVCVKEEKIFLKFHQDDQGCEKEVFEKYLIGAGLKNYPSHHLG
jgi:hypothetical protein